MERHKTELALEALLPQLEAEHAAEANDDVREAIWTLIDSAETYLLTRQEARRRPASSPSS